MPLLRSFLAATVVATFLAACGGSGSPSDPGDTRESKSNPSFAADVQEIFTRKGCGAASCHGSAAGGLILGSNGDANYGVLVGVPSMSEPNFNRVAPNDATNSYLVIKLEGRQRVGARMPLRGSFLDNIDLTNIRNWINTGAPNN